MENLRYKFRAWDVFSKRMNTGFHLMGEMLTLGGLECWLCEVKNPDRKSSIDRWNDLIFMQYTGFPDKNGKEIYANDIVKFTDVHSFICPVYYLVHVQIGLYPCLDTGDTLSGCYGECLDTLDAHPNNSLKGLWGAFNNKWVDEICEVIGNIHENPELLEIRK